MGVPLNAPVEDRTFSDEYGKHWVKLTGAYNKFMDAFLAGKSHLAKRRLNGIRKEMQNCDAFLIKLCGGNVVTPVYKSEQDKDEAGLLAWFLTERSMPFVKFWEETFDALIKSGEARTFHDADIPRWFDDEP
jgi:hypothetical protein